MPDTHKSPWQYMHQEATDKLAVMQGHDLRLIVPVIFVAKSNLILVDVDEALITNRNTMRVTREILVASGVQALPVTRV